MEYRLSVELTMDLLVISSMMSLFILNFSKKPLVISEKIRSSDSS